MEFRRGSVGENDFAVPVNKNRVGQERENLLVTATGFHLVFDGLALEIQQNFEFGDALVKLFGGTGGDFTCPHLV